MKARFSVELVELSVRHWGSQVRTESFRKFGSERLRKLSLCSQDGFRANAKEKELRREKDSTGAGSRRWKSDRLGEGARGSALAGTIVVSPNRSLVH